MTDRCPYCHGWFYPDEYHTHLTLHHEDDIDDYEYDAETEDAMRVDYDEYDPL